MRKPAPILSAIAALLAVCLILPPQALALRVSEPAQDPARRFGMMQAFTGLEENKDQQQISELDVLLSEALGFSGSLRIPVVGDTSSGEWSIGSNSYRLVLRWRHIPSRKNDPRILEVHATVRLEPRQKERLNGVQFAEMEKYRFGLRHPQISNGEMKPLEVEKDAGNWEAPQYPAGEGNRYAETNLSLELPREVLSEQRFVTLHVEPVPSIIVVPFRVLPPNDPTAGVEESAQRRKQVSDWVEQALIPSFAASTMSFFQNLKPLREAADSYPVNRTGSWRDFSNFADQEMTAPFPSAPRERTLFMLDHFNRLLGWMNRHWLESAGLMLYPRRNILETPHTLGDLDTGQIQWLRRYRWNGLETTLYGIRSPQGVGPLDMNAAYIPGAYGYVRSDHSERWFAGIDQEVRDPVRWEGRRNVSSHLIESAGRRPEVYRFMWDVYAELFRRMGALRWAQGDPFVQANRRLSWK